MKRYTTASRAQKAPHDPPLPQPNAVSPPPGAAQQTNLPACFEDKEFCEKLRCGLFKLTSDHELLKDLAQEAKFHIWVMLAKKPGQTLSWYLQSGLDKASDCLKRGRSLDSEKHRAGALQINDDEERQTLDLQGSYSFEPEASFFDTLCRTDFLDHLSPKLKPQAQSVLRCLREGLTSQEIAARTACTARHVRQLVAAITEEGRRLETHHAAPAVSTHSKNAVTADKLTGTDMEGLAE